MTSLWKLAFIGGGALALLVVFQVVLRFTAQGKTLTQDLEGKNTARAILHAGNVLGVLLVGARVASGVVDGEDAMSDVLWLAIFGATALAVFFIAARLGVRLLVRSRLPEAIASGNAAAGLVAAAHALATAIIIGRVFAGHDPESLGISLVFFVIAQATLHILVILFRWVTAYDDAEEVLGGNIAAGLSYAGCTIAVGIIVGRAAEGVFESWASSFKAYGIALAYGLGLYVVRQFVVQGLVCWHVPALYGGPLDKAVARDRNIGIAALEASAYVATALVLDRV